MSDPAPPRKRRKKPVSVTPRSMTYLQEQGWLAEKVEHPLPGNANTTRDLFGFIDILAVKPGETLAVQVTTTSHQADRITKIANHPNVAAVREAGWAIHVHGWLKNAQGLWVLTVTDVS